MQNERSVVLPGYITANTRFYRGGCELRSHGEEIKAAVEDNGCDFY